MNSEMIDMQIKPEKYVRIRLSIEIYEQIKSFAKEDYRTVPSEIRQILKFYIKFRMENESHRSKGLWLTPYEK